MASKRRLRRKSCTGKVRHATVQSGQAMLHQLNKSKGYQGPMNVYGCTFCGGCHIGHRPGSGGLK